MINRITAVQSPGNGRGRERTRASVVPASPPIAARPKVDLATRLGGLIGDHPVLSLSLGLTIGIVVGCLVKRR